LSPIKLQERYGMSIEANLLHHPLVPPLVASQCVTLADGHRHFRNIQTQQTTITSEDIKKKLSDAIGGNPPDTNGGSSTQGGDGQLQPANDQQIPIHQDESSVMNQLFSNYLLQADLQPVEQQFNDSAPYSNTLDNVLCGMNCISMVHKAELQTLYNMCEDYIDRMQHTLHIEKQSAKLNSKQRGLLQHQLVYGSNPIVYEFSQSGSQMPNGTQNSQSLNTSADGMDGMSDGSLDDYPLVEIKKTEDVVKELKKRYSGDVLNLAKKKKNFSKSATDVLNVWFFQHLHDPYPSDDEKRILSQQTGLSLSQVNNWFGNKRMRYKRKMLEQNRRGGQKGAGGSGDQSPGDDDSPQQLQFHNDQDFSFN